MRRRSFLTTLGLLGSSRLLGGFSIPNPASPELHTAALGLDCTPFDMNGVQRCEAGIDSSILDVVASDTQHESQWCWAACIEAVFTYYDHPVPQDRIVSEIWGDVVNMPGAPLQILSALNRKWTDQNGDDFTSQGTSLGTNAITAAQDLAADHPLIIGTLGHAMVLTSLTYLRDVYSRGQVQLAEVRDPWPYNQRHRALTPQEWYSISFAARIRVADA
jgi:hypothetical protein